MVYKSIDGVYRNGRVELPLTFKNVPEGTRVLVTFLCNEVSRFHHPAAETEAAELKGLQDMYEKELEEPCIDLDEAG